MEVLEISSNTEDICGIPIPVYSPNTLGGAETFLAAGGQGRVFSKMLQAPAGKAMSAFESRVSHADSKVVVKHFGNNDERSSAVESAIGSMLCSSISPCPDGLPFNAFLGSLPTRSSTIYAADRLFTVVMEQARSGDVHSLLIKGEKPSTKQAWETFASGVSLIPGGTPELALARDLDAVLALLQQLAIGLRHMKERGIMHR